LGTSLLQKFSISFSNEQCCCPCQIITSNQLKSNLLPDQHLKAQLSVDLIFETANHAMPKMYINTSVARKKNHSNLPT
jgi:hypothetical protein